MWGEEERILLYVDMLKLIPWEQLYFNVSKASAVY